MNSLPWGPDPRKQRGPTPMQQHGAPGPGPLEPRGPEPRGPESIEPRGPEAAGPGAPGRPPAPTVDQVLEDARRRAGDRVIDTSSGRDDGLDKCPRCGSTESAFSIAEVALVCQSCRFEWNEPLLEDRVDVRDIKNLRGTVTGSAAGALRDGHEMMTLECQGCGAEVVITTDRSLQARCHWCRQVLSVQTQIPNGAVPDAILPFRVPHDAAVARIREFAGKRRFFSLSAFRREFTPENVVGVYMPYMLIDANCQADLRGTGEVLRRRYQVRVSKEHTETRYDADAFAVGRRFRFTVDDLASEASSEREANTRVNTNNVIDTIQPFDTKQAVGFNPAYLRDFTSERRDLEIGDMGRRVEGAFLSIARAQAQRTLGGYDRGVRWEGEALGVEGSRWFSLYLPVWLYSYQQRKSDGSSFIHYIAVNGRTGETMGSVPVSHPVIFAVSALAGIAAFVVSLPLLGLLFV